MFTYTALLINAKFFFQGQRVLVSRGHYTIVEIIFAINDYNYPPNKYPSNPPAAAP
jgi:hypothetical protein